MQVLEEEKNKEKQQTQKREVEYLEPHRTETDEEGNILPVPVQEFLRKSTITQANFAAAAGPLAVIRFPSCTTSSSLKIAPLCCK